MIIWLQLVIRKKIDDDFDVKLIQTVRGIGYMLTEPD